MKNIHYFMVTCEEDKTAFISLRPGNNLKVDTCVRDNAS